MGQANNLWIEVPCSFAVLAVVAISYKFLHPNGGRVWKIHAIYFASAICTIVFLPHNIATHIFTDLTVTLVGAVYPIYRATKAVCTPFEDDDKEWLQFWMLGGVMFMVTTWVDDIIIDDRIDDIWFGSLLFSFFWLYFPLTCGAMLVYEKITQPLLGPCFKPLQERMSNVILYIYQALTNATHLYFLWFFFILLPAGSKRAVAVAIGTVYPFISSVSATATDDMEDDSYWLTYWAVYGCLFLFMDLLETWLGQVPGFYSLIISATVYLMLPMFRGADKVFRNILVPLAGLQELLILRDSLLIRNQMLKSLNPDRSKAVSRSIARFFNGESDAADPDVLRKELKQSWSALNISRSVTPSGFGKKSSKYEEPHTVNPQNLV